jgi:hypothetical protein
MTDITNKKENKKNTENWAEMSDNDADEQLEEEAKKDHTIKPAKKTKEFKNSRGDYVVTAIDIPDMRTGMKNKDEDGEAVEDSSDSDTEYDEEDDTKEQAPV